MTCRHKRGDRSCTTQFPEYAGAGSAESPDVENFEVIDVAQCKDFFVLKVAYPNCRKCAYEGTKILVYHKVTPLDAMRWRRIDPHFSDPKLKRTKTEAPAPIARFPGSEEGWKAALWFAQNY
jgi:hypothetical protein